MGCPIPSCNVVIILRTILVATVFATSLVHLTFRFIISKHSLIVTLYSTVPGVCAKQHFHRTASGSDANRMTASRVKPARGACARVDTLSI